MMADMSTSVDSQRRTFLKMSIGAVAAAGFPAIVPSSVFGQKAPSNRINIGAIGVGRISRGHDLPGIWQFDQARIMAVCDLDSNRVEEGKALVNGYYAKKTGKDYDGVTGYHNYRELLANKDIDAVVISTPDHQHTILAVDAVHAGERRVPAEAGVADHCRGARNEQCSDGVRADSADRIATTVMEAVSPGMRVGAQWTHRRNQACGNWLARRPKRTGCAGHADSAEPRLRRLAWVHARGLLH